MSENKQPSFLDRGTIIAFAVILVFWFGWQKWMEKNYPQPVAAPTADVAATTKQPVANDPSGKPTAKTDPAAPTAAHDAAVAGNVAPANETLTHYSNGPWEFDISSIGMGLKNIQLKEYTSRDGKTIQLSGVEGDPSFATRVAPYDKPLMFAITKESETKYVGTATLEDGTKIEKTMDINPAGYSVQTTIKVSSIGKSFKGLSTRIADEMTEPAEKAHFFDPTPDFHQWFALHEGSKSRQLVKKKNSESFTFEQPDVTVASLSIHYFALAVADESSIHPKFESKLPPNPTVAVGQLIYEPSTMPETLQVSYKAVAAPKSLPLLQSIDENLGDVIDYGFFAVIAKPLLGLLRFLHTFISNWGLAVIVLTLLVRLVILPFNVYSYRSMKVMQKLQPQMNAIRERYKDKSAEEKLQMNNEIMKLMKENKANPMGGCLPMLLQLPVLMAFYQTLGQSIELYQAPFMFWIHDLSMRDPLFVLPVLMGVTMFIQQRMTPSQMDPQQAKIMMWMPVIFCVFMISLPSALTLYIFVSTLFGIIQQYAFLRDRKPAGTLAKA